MSISLAHWGRQHVLFQQKFNEHVPGVSSAMVTEETVPNLLILKLKKSVRNN